MKVTAAAALNDLRQLQPEQLLARASSFLPPWIVGVLIVALAWELAQFTWALVPQGDPRPVAKPPASVTGPITESSAPAADLQAIVTGHIFGVYTKDAGPATDQPIDEVPVSNMFKLLGVYYSTDEKYSSAIISDDHGDADVYTVGQALGARYKLDSIKPTLVLIKTGEKLEKIELPQEGDSGGAGPARVARATPIQRQPPPGSQTSQIEEALGAASMATPLTDLVRPQPVYADGKQLGYRVYPGRNRQQFTKLGLKPGDLVTQINGAALDDPARGLEIFKVLEEGNQVSVTVERDGQSQVIVLDSSTLSNLAEPAEE